MTVCDVCKEPATATAIVATQGVSAKNGDDRLYGLPFRWLDLCDEHRIELVNDWGQVFA